MPEQEDPSIHRLKTQGINFTQESINKIIGDAMYSVDESYPEPEKIDAPEGWEEKRRAHWMEELEPGTYVISAGNISLSTGKGGAVQYYIALEKALLNYK